LLKINNELVFDNTKYYVLIENDEKYVRCGRENLNKKKKICNIPYIINMKNKRYISGVIALDITLLFNTV